MGEIQPKCFFSSPHFLHADEMDGEVIRLILNLLCSIVCGVIGVTVVLAAVGKTLGIRKLYTSVLIYIFEVKILLILGCFSAYRIV